jgi:hypothetical protein
LLAAFDVLGTAQASAPLTFLRARGQDIVNESGTAVHLRGVGLGNWLLPEGYMWKFGNQGDRPRKIEKIVSDLIGPDEANQFWTTYRRSYITETDIQRLAELGYNSVRPALNSRLFLDANNAPDLQAEGFQLLDRLVSACKAHGVYVVIDMHAAPGGQTGQNIDDSANNEPELFTNPKHQDELVALWEALARRYKDEPAVAGYDLLNEPLPARTGAAHAHKAQLEPLYRRVTAAIRAIDPKHIIILEGADWSNDWSVFTKPFDRNLVYQFHYYCWDSPSTVKNIQRYLEARQRLNAPVWVGETGEKDSAIYWATTEYFEANNIGWSFWPWKKMDTRNTPFSIKAPQDWEAVAAYSRGGDKPSPAVARKALDELLVNVRMENCVYYPDIVHGMLREAPARIEAENFGVDGPGNSYFVKNTNAPSHFYRVWEAVPVTAQETGRRQSEQYIKLQATEWTAYTIHSAATEKYRLTVRARSAQTNSELQVLVGDETFTCPALTADWSKIDLGAVTLTEGANHLKCRVTQGAADVDWLQLDVSMKPEQAARAEATTAKKAN